MDEKIDAELDERPLMVGPPLLVTAAHLDLERRVHLFLLGPFEQILALLEQIAGDDLALLAVDRHRNDGMRQKSLWLAAEEQDRRDAGTLDSVVVDQKTQFPKESP